MAPGLRDALSPVPPAGPHLLSEPTARNSATTSLRPNTAGTRAPSSKTLTRPGLRGACGSSAPGSLATDSGLDFHSDWGPGSSCVSGSARSFCPFWFATSQRARTGLPRLGPLLLLPPPPVARGEGGDTDWGGGKGGGEARRLSGPAGRGRRAVPRTRGPGLPPGAGRGRRGSWPGPEAAERAPGLRARRRGLAACGRSRCGSRPGSGAPSLPGLSFPPDSRRAGPDRGLVGVWSEFPRVPPGEALSRGFESRLSPLSAQPEGGSWSCILARGVCRAELGSQGRFEDRP